VAIGARDTESKQMENLIETALFKARAASDRASAHLEFVTMFASADMPRLADQRRKSYESESRMAEIYYAMAAEIAA
jgi:hypothetical protein